MTRVKSKVAKNAEREQKIKRALDEWRMKGIPFRVLSLMYGIPHSTLRLSDRARGGKNRHEAHQHQQALPPSTERALEVWAWRIDRLGFPPRLDLFKAAMAAYLVEIK